MGSTLTVAGFGLRRMN
ncbi:MAG: hypothetical protein F9K14_02125 [Candidatus Methanoperedens sp.]|nr:MAG: hypothetical protein F9K14_02125 [Candidatus Methanoperedens sp.]MBZ0173872.1 hypothetical protein [Candidatus Methanoperedens nitroreducens]